MNRSDILQWYLLLLMLPFLAMALASMQEQFSVLEDYARQCDVRYASLGRYVSDAYMESSSLQLQLDEASSRLRQLEVCSGNYAAMQQAYDSCEARYDAIKWLRAYENLDLRPFDLLISNANNHTYDRQSYNCVDYSREAVAMLRSRGWSARTMITKMENGERHMFIVMPLAVEPQTGMVIPPEAYEAYGIVEDML